MNQAAGTGLDITGRPTTQPRLRVGFIGCGSHAFRNIYPTLRFLPVELAAVCDLDATRAALFARQFGAARHYTDHQRMLAAEALEAVFIVTSYDERRRPRYPALAIDCLGAGCHVWMEKPPAAACAEVERMQAAATAARRQAAVGFKKAFSPANRRAHRLIASGVYGRATLTTMQYRQRIPTPEEFDAYARGAQPLAPGSAFLDHLCHPVSGMLAMFGMPASLWYARSFSGAGSAVFEYGDGLVVSLALNAEASRVGGMERTIVTLERGYELMVENNIRLALHGPMQATYAATGDFFADEAYDGSPTWEPEFSLGTLYNKAEFIQGFYDELADFVNAARENRLPAVGGRLQQAWEATRIFEAFFEGPRKTIALPACPWADAAAHHDAATV